MKICIFGAGVIGGILGCALKRAGHEVVLIARGAHLETIRKEGLTMVLPEARYTLSFPAGSDPKEFGPQDLVIVATKTTALPDVALSIAPLIGAETLVGFAQNGVLWFYGDGFRPGQSNLDTRRLDPEGHLHRVIGAARALGIVCFSGGEIEEPGVIKATRAGGQFHIGPALTELTDRCQLMTDEFGVQDVNISATPDIRSWMWRKHISVVSNQAISCLTGATIGQNHAHNGVHETILRLMAETNSVAEAHGFTDLGFDIEEKRQNPMTSPHKPSMLQDIERGRPAEIPAQYLILQDLARQADLQTPMLDTIVPLLEMRAEISGSYKI